MFAKVVKFYQIWSHCLYLQSFQISLTNVCMFTFYQIKRVITFSRTDAGSVRSVQPNRVINNNSFNNYNNRSSNHDNSSRNNISSKETKCPATAAGFSSSRSRAKRSPDWRCWTGETELSGWSKILLFIELIKWVSFRSFETKYL